jgi:D-tyrosyl-tRNA(Tyr) deacylase
MRLVIQRVKKAKVTSNSQSLGEIGKGLFVLVGVGNEDKKEDARVLAEKLVKLRVMPDDTGKMNLSVKDTGGEILVVSQFTLYADTSGGNRPSFIKAAPPNKAKEIYEEFVQLLKQQGVKVETGNFGSYMEIESVADGPVTIILEYPKSLD